MSANKISAQKQTEINTIGYTNPEGGRLGKRRVDAMPRDTIDVHARLATANAYWECYQLKESIGIYTELCLKNRDVEQVVEKIREKVPSLLGMALQEKGEYDSTGEEIEAMRGFREALDACYTAYEGLSTERIVKMETAITGMIGELKALTEWNDADDNAWTTYRAQMLLPEEDVWERCSRAYKERQYADAFQVMGEWLYKKGDEGEKMEGIEKNVAKFVKHVASVKELNQDENDTKLAVFFTEVKTFIRATGNCLERYKKNMAMTIAFNIATKEGIQASIDEWLRDEEVDPRRMKKKRTGD